MVSLPFRYPVFVMAKDSKEVLRFDSLAEMQRKLERIDVENAEYEAWDAGGVKLLLSTRDPAWLVVESSGDQEDIAGLVAALAEYGKTGGVDVTANLESPGDTYRDIRSRLNSRRKSRGFLLRLLRGERD